MLSLLVKTALIALLGKVLKKTLFAINVIFTSKDSIDSTSGQGFKKDPIRYQCYLY